LEEGFKDPPREYTSVPLWSWNGTLDPDQLRWQIDQMVDKGVYGAFLHARAGINLGDTSYFSDGWWEAVEATVEHSATVGFQAWLYDEDKWPSGAAGGRTFEANPERNRLKGLKPVEVKLKGPGKHTIAIAGARYVIAGRLKGSRRVDGGTLVNITEFNNDLARAIDPTPTKGLRVLVVTDGADDTLAVNAQLLGCAVESVGSGERPKKNLDDFDVVVSNIGTQGAGYEAGVLMEWIRAGGGYIDFSHSEPTDQLYAVDVNVEGDASGHNGQFLPSRR
jgi:hypothetical protein